MDPSKRTLVIVALAAAVVAPAAGQAGEVIAHPALNLTPDEVREVYLGDKQLAGSTKIVPVDNATQQADFLAKVMQIDAARYDQRWTRKSFREGLMMPSMKGSDAEVLAFVRGTPGAVGYVTVAGAGVKVLQKY